MNEGWRRSLSRGPQALLGVGRPVTDDHESYTRKKRRRLDKNDETDDEHWTDFVPMPFTSSSSSSSSSSSMPRKPSPGINSINPRTSPAFFSGKILPWTVPRRFWNNTEKLEQCIADHMTMVRHTRKRIQMLAARSDDLVRDIRGQRQLDDELFWCNAKVEIDHVELGSVSYNEPSEMEGEEKEKVKWEDDLD